MSGFIPHLEKLGFHEHGAPKGASYPPPQEDTPDLLGTLASINDSGEVRSPNWLYIWNHSYMSPLAMAEFPPPSNLPKLKWGLQVAERVLNLLHNEILIEVDQTRRVELQEHVQELRDEVTRQDLKFDTLRTVVADIVHDGRLKSASDRPRDIDDYAKLFRTIGLPAISSDFNQDSAFAAMRTAGPNPLVIELCSELPDNFPITEKQFQFVMTGDRLEAALAEHRLYICDYKELSALQPATSLPQKTLYAPIALFAQHKSSLRLVPVAIQVQQTPSPDNPVVVADGSYDWLMAKAIVEMADGNHHELISHLGRTHLYMEPFVVATGRNLPSTHPVAMLLWPHFEGTLFINFAAVFGLLRENGPVDQLLGGSLDSDKQVAAQGVLDLPFNDAFLPRTFEARRVGNLKEYAYRDDALLYWDAIRAWVHGYLELAYQPQGGIEQDVALQRWYRDLVSEKGGRVKGFGEDGALRSRDYLEQALTLILYTSSVQHAAVNFPQFDLMSYCPNMPLASYAQFLVGAGYEQALDLLPPLQRARLQQRILYLLGTVHYTELGQYGEGYFRPQVEVGPLARFRLGLEGIGSKIAQRNLTRRPYNTLVPSGIPQSINI